MPADILISIFAAVGFALTGIYVIFARRHRPTWKAGVVLLFSCAELTLARALQGFSADFAAKLFWYKMCYAGFSVVPIGFFCLALWYTGRGRWITRRTQFALSVVPALFVGLVFTNEFHGWVWNPASTARIVNTMLFPPIADARLGYWLFVVSAYGLLGMGCFYLVRFAVRNRGIYDWQLYAVILATILAAIGCALDILGLSPLPPFTAAVLGLAVGIILVVIALAALRRRDALAISRDAVLNNITDGIIVVDGYDWIVDLNPAAEKLTGKAAQVIGRPLAQILPELSAILTVHAPFSSEVVVARGNMLLTFDLRTSTIQDRQGRVASQVIVLRDITDRKRMETELTAEREAERKFSAQLTILAAVTNELSKSGTLDEFCCCAVEAGREKLGFDRLGLWFVSEDRSTMLGTYGTDVEGQTTDERQARHPIPRNSRLWAVVEGSQTLQQYKNVPLHQNGKQVGMGARITAGLWDGETVIGFLSIDNLINHRAFSEHDCELLHLYASTLGHLYTLKRAQAALAALYETSQTLGASLNLDEALRTVLDSAIRLTGAERGCLMLFDATGGQIIFRLARNAQQEMLAESRFEISHSVMDEVVQTGQPVITINAQDDPRFADKGSVMKYALRSVMAAPLTVHGKITGVLYVDNKVKDALFNPRNLTLFNTFAGQAAVTLENAQLYETVRQHAAELEDRVAERTAKLELANKELESFSYSVSHDLRAPLRAIDGYIGMLVDEHETSFDAESKRLFAIVQNEARRMGDLINGLLAISRLSYIEMRTIVPIDMAGLAHSVFEELTSPEDRQRIDFQIAALPRAMGDSILIHQVWANLISNAIKFSSKRERAIIRISANQTDNEVVYAVSDNGVGFDMQYASKLFGVFQRLHSEDEFSGNGVGLATVQRIVQRHNGRVWAESEVGQGTVFCFSLRQERVD
jgi:PAS domain S-box-containing protein